MDGPEPGGLYSVPTVQRIDSRWARRHHEDGGARLLATENNLATGPALQSSSRESGDGHFIHSFDTDGRDLQRSGYALELLERPQGMVVVAARTGGDSERTGRHGTAQAQIDRAWASDILCGVMSPLVALEWRLGKATPSLVENVRAIVGGRKLLRIASSVAGHAPAGKTVSTTAWMSHVSGLPRTNAAK